MTGKSRKARWDHGLTKRERNEIKRKGADPSTFTVQGCREILGSGSRCGEPTKDKSPYCPKHS